MTIKHGLKVVEINTGARALMVAATAVIGLIATATVPAPNQAAYPYNTPILVTNYADAIAKVGTAGTAADALTAISRQSAPVTVLVLVAPGQDEAATTTAVIGTVNSTGQRTGLQALLSAPTELGITPRILGAPDLDNQAVTTALITVAQKLGGFVYASCNADTVAEAVTYRANFSARELMLLTPDIKVWDATAGGGTGGPVPESPVGTAMGLRARIDDEQGWHKSLSNVPFEGALGLTESISWDMMDSANDAGVLNAAEITTIVRNPGFRFWGNRTTSEEPLFAFEVATRTAQVIRATISEGLLWAIDKPLTAGLVTDLVETNNASLRLMTAQGYILGGHCWYDPSVNPTQSLQAGQLVLDYDFTPVPPLEHMTLNQRITDRYFANFAALAG